MKQQTIVFKVSDNLKNEMIDFYSDSFEEKKPPYSVFQVKQYDCVITLYESGKVMFQGIGGDIEASYWTEQERIKNNRNINEEIDEKNKKRDEKKEKDKNDKKNEIDYNSFSCIGSDEVGTGDYFGPIVVTASFVDKSKRSWLYNLGIKDSKKMTDEKILAIAPKLIKDIPHTTFILDPKSYNKAGITNMNKVKAILHNKVLVSVVKMNLPYEKIVVDEFVYPKKYYEHISDASEKINNITFTTKAEDKCLAVAVSSIISRYIFIKEIDKYSDELHIPLPKGAGEAVDKIGEEIVKKYSFEKLKDISKFNFKNTNKIKELIN